MKRNLQLFQEMIVSKSYTKDMEDQQLNEEKLQYNYTDPAIA